MCFEILSVFVAAVTKSLHSKSCGDVSKKLCLQWKRLEVVNEVVYRRLPGSKLGEEDYLQLLVPKSDVEEVLRLCHARKEVDGRIMAEACKSFGVTKLRTLPYKPSTNQV